MWLRARASISSQTGLSSCSGGAPAVLMGPAAAAFALAGASVVVLTPWADSLDSRAKADSRETPARQTGMASCPTASEEIDMPNGFVDIHCHLVPGIDDGARDAADSLAMAMLAVEEGIKTVVVTPHQLGSFSSNTGDEIRVRVAELQELLHSNDIPLRVLPGADVRIDSGMVQQVLQGEVLSLGDHRKHVLLELPHELYLPLEPLLDELASHGMVGILSHPERNQGILQRPSLIEPLVEAGCLMQVTAGSLNGAFGTSSQSLAEQMCRRGLVHFLATDAHGPKSRRPKMRQAYERARELAGPDAATLWCSTFPRCVAEGKDVPGGVVQVSAPRRSMWSLLKRAA